MQTGPERTNALSPEDFAALGMQGVAYVRRVLERVDARAGADSEAIVVFAIHSAAGERIGGAPSRELAFAAIRQHGLEPVDAH